MKLFKSIFFISVLIFTIMVLNGCHDSKKDEQYSSIPVVTVSPIHPKYERIPLIITANGLIRAWQEAIIGAEVGGLDVTNVYVNVGDKVTKGEILAKFNAAQVEADLENQIANVAEAEANLEQAKVEAKQAKSLEKVGAISSQELLKYTTAAKTTLAKLNAANANLALQKLRLSYAIIKSPDDGIISSRTATVGSIIQSGSEMFRLITKGRLEWQAEVGLDDISRVESGDTVLIQVSQDKQIAGTVRRTSPTLNSNTKSGIVFIDLPYNSSLKIGMSVAGKILAGSRHSMVIPFKSVVSSDGYNYVMLISSGNLIHKVKVTLGDINESMVEVISGVNLKDTLVLDGATFLNESDLVRIEGSGK